MDERNNIHDATAFDQPLQNDTIIKVIGVGGGGNNAVNYMHSQGIENVSFAVCNTDKQALRRSPVEDKLLLGPDVTFGLGAGDKPELGRMAAEASVEDIRQLLDDGTEMVFITAGMGGGTGTGAAPIVAKVAKDANLLTVGIVTIPFLFEGEQKIFKALDGAEEMRKNVDTLLIINNERLTEIYKDLNFINAFSKADDTLANAARSIAEIINCNGYINADFNDVKTTLKDSGTAIISTGYAEGENRVTGAINDALNSPLLKNSDISTSKRLLFFLYFNPNAKKPVKMEEMSEITQFSAKLSHNIGVKWGAGFDESLGEGVKMTILASGFDITVRDTSNDDNHEAIIFAPETISEPELQKDTKNDDRLKEEYGADKIIQHQQELARARYVVLEPWQFDNDEVIEMLENTPVGNRESTFKDNLKKIGNSANEPITDMQQTGTISANEPGANTIVF